MNPRRRYTLVTAILCTLSGIAHAAPDDADLTDGLTLRIYQLENKLEYLPVLIENQTPNLDTIARDTTLGSRASFGDFQAPFYATLSGFIRIDRAGTYTFRLLSDDGSRLKIGDRSVIANDGPATGEWRVSRSLELQPGLHPIVVEYFDSGGRATLKLEWKAAGDASFKPLPPEVLRTENDPTRVTSPGPKKVTQGRRPGDGRPLDAVHPGWAASPIQTDAFEPKVGAMTVLPDGRLVVGTFSPLQRDDRNLPDIESKVPDKLYAISHVADESKPAEVRVIADNLYEPTGLCVVDGVLYVAHRKAVTRLLDKDGDGFLETHEDVGGGWDAWNYHQFTFGLLHRDGKLYTALSTAMAPPDWEGMGTNSAPNGPMRGGIIEIDLASNDTRVVAGGTRTPNGLGFGPDGAMFYADNQGTWMPTSQFAEVIPGRFYGHHNRANVVPKLTERFPDGGHPSAFGDRPRTPAALWLPQSELSNSPTQPVLIESGPFKGQMLLGELTAGGIRRLFLERVNGQWQGAAFHFTQGLSCGVNRLAFAPNGDLYVGGIGALGNWNWRGTKSGLQRLSPTGKDVFEMHSMAAAPDGFIVRFTQAVDEHWLADPAHYELTSWRYEPTADYGGPKIDERDAKILRATPMDGGRAVRLQLEHLEPGRVYHLRTDPTSTAGQTIWATEAWYTLNQIPTLQPAQPATIAGRPLDLTNGLGVGVLPPADGVPLISASAEPNFRRGNNRDEPKPRDAADLLNLPGYVEVGGGDLVSNTSFGDARLHIEFYCPPGGTGQLAANSGIYLQGLYELQVLGTTPDAAPKNNELGAIYQQRAPDVNASTGPGTWQAYDIWFRAPRFVDGRKTENARATIYLNGTLIHRDIEITAPTGSKAAAGEPGSAANPATPIQTGPLVLQDHETKAQGPVRYRNVWISPLEPMRYTEGPWQRLIDAQNLDGWLIRGGQASYRVEAGDKGSTIVGTSAPDTPNTFLVSEKAYRDFELLLDVKQHVDLNSGIQIRSHIEGGLETRDGKLFGYQVELDPSDRAYTGAIYDESRRGWLQRLVDAPSARRAVRRDDWNTIRIVAKGPTIQTWVNGIPAASIFDAIDTDGHIGLQVHGVGDKADPMTVQWRNVRLRELTPAKTAN